MNRINPKIIEEFYARKAAKKPTEDAGKADSSKQQEEKLIDA